jgi:hypothetical protein
VPVARSSALCMARSLTATLRAQFAGRLLQVKADIDHRLTKPKRVC